MSFRSGLQLSPYRGAVLAFGWLLGCTATERCEAPGECAAGMVCSEGRCVESVGTLRDATPTDTGSPLPDARADAGAAAPPDAGLRDLGAGATVDGGQRYDAMSVTPDTWAWPTSGFGASCVVPDFTLGETDPCGVDDPNYFCVARLNGAGGYCTRACVVEAVNDGHHGGIDIGWHPHPHPCDEIGCCLPVEPGVDAGPFMPIDRICRFGSDCN